MQNSVRAKRGRRTWILDHLRRSAAVSFHCEGVAVDLVNHVAWPPEGAVALRPQEVRLLRLLSATPNRVVPSLEILRQLYEGVPLESAKVRLKTLVADIRRRLGPRVGSRLRAAHGVGLILYVDGMTSEAQAQRFD